MVKPGADPSQIALHFSGASSVKALKNRIDLGTQIGTRSIGDLVVYQNVNGKQKRVAASFSQTGSQTVIAVVLVDARNGVVEQTRRHAAVAALLRVPHLVLAVNKMDLVDYAEPLFAAIAAEFTAYALELGVGDITAIPISALAGDNVVERPATWTDTAAPTLPRRTWRPSPSPPPPATNRPVPVQYVIRPQIREHPNRLRRRVGLRHPAHRRHRHRPALRPHRPIAGIADPAPTPDRLRPPVDHRPPHEDIDISPATSSPPACSPSRQGRRGHRLPPPQRPLRGRDKVLLNHTTHGARAGQGDLLPDRHRHPRQRSGAKELNVNDIGHIVLRTAEPLALDDYTVNRRTGSFLLIDPADGTTLTAGDGRRVASPHRLKGRDARQPRGHPVQGVRADAVTGGRQALDGLEEHRAQTFHVAREDLQHLRAGDALALTRRPRPGR